MTDEKWQSTIGHIKDNFEVLDHREEVMPETNERGRIETIEFKSPLGRVKLERTSLPLVLDKKTIGSKRIGSQAHVEYIYSDTEMTHKMRAYRFDESQQDWIELSEERGSMLF